METNTLIAIILAGALVIVAMSMVVVAVMAYMIAKLYAPEELKRRPVPSLGKALTKLAGGGLVDRAGMIEGVNGYPDEAALRERAAAGETPQVAETAVVTEVMGAAEGNLATERERWWEEKREDGYDDDEILAMEQGAVVPVFEDAS